MPFVRSIGFRLATRDVLLQIGGVHMSRQAVGRALMVLSALTVAACGLWSKKADLPKYDPALYASNPTPIVSPTPTLGWSEGAEYAIVVRKHEHTLTLYHWTEQEKVYPVVLGIAP